eukprot:CAMPEP_0197662154 /NCGR_PEP_ID=MMETSP1338-20131121/52296_1 /TAXON_ID=43686 ORGANISM="Pelagodinium beii, Strain RCC1491" /NCGR_SAMPLE_ID=MMETSP1338 /ASSEMBLY_ACC=CAM_ASM_000754 /LENGTH=249 /DNA_ID=CAMNT_0043239873 /DNA_START=35 /DNA_END=780 /DNA_ORIENTATION=+
MSKCSTLSGRTLKVTHGEDTRRLQLEIPEGANCQEALEAIRAAVRTCFNLQDRCAKMTLKYTDEEGDSCTLMEGTVEDFALVSSEGLLRLNLELPAESAEKAESCGTSEPKTSEAPRGRDENAEWWVDFLQRTDPETLHSMATAFVSGLSQPGALPAGVPPILPGLAAGFLQNMDPAVLHSLASTAAAAAARGSTGPPNADFLSGLVAMFASKGQGKGTSPGNEEAQSSAQQPPNPLEAMMAAFAGKAA